MAKKHLTPEKWAIAEALGRFAEARGRSLLDVAFSWLAQREPVASVIAGATRPEQVEQNVRAATWSISPEDLTEIDRITLGSAGTRPTG
jgi:aryl-alcohol dehydrogenase-like predicted oxidoreductase